MAQRQLNIRSDEAYALATTMARRRRLSTQEIVVRALRDFAKSEVDQPSERTLEQEASYEQLVSLGRLYRRRWKYGEGSDHSDMYDEYGLPV